MKPSFYSELEGQLKIELRLMLHEVLLRLGKGIVARAEVREALHRLLGQCCCIAAEANARVKFMSRLSALAGVFQSVPTARGPGLPQNGLVWRRLVNIYKTLLLPFCAA